LVDFNCSFFSLWYNWISLANFQKIMVRRIRKCSTRNKHLVNPTFTWKGHLSMRKKSRFFRNKKTRKENYGVGALCRKSHGGALKLVASRERHYARLLAGSHVIFHCTSSPRDPLNFPSRSRYLRKDDSSSYENDARILYCVIDPL